MHIGSWRLHILLLAASAEMSLSFLPFLNSIHCPVFKNSIGGRNSQFDREVPSCSTLESPNCDLFWCRKRWKNNCLQSNVSFTDRYHGPYHKTILSINHATISCYQLELNFYSQHHHSLSSLCLSPLTSIAAEPFPVLCNNRTEKQTLNEWLLNRQGHSLFCVRKTFCHTGRQNRAVILVFTTSLLWRWL